MKVVNLIDFSELLEYAKNKGFGWNETHKEIAGLYPRDGIGTLTFKKDEIIKYVPKKEYQTLVSEFMDYNNVTELTVTF